MAWREALMPCGASAALNWSKPSHAQLSPKARKFCGPAAAAAAVADDYRIGPFEALRSGPRH